MESEAIIYEITIKSEESSLPQHHLVDMHASYGSKKNFLFINPLTIIMIRLQIVIYLFLNI